MKAENYLYTGSSENLDKVLEELLFKHLRENVECDIYFIQ